VAALPPEVTDDTGWEYRVDAIGATPCLAWHGGMAVFSINVVK